MKALKIVRDVSVEVKVNLKGEKKTCYLLKNPCDLEYSCKQTLFREFFPMTLEAYRQREDYLWFKEAVWERMFHSGSLLLFFDGDKGVAYKGYDEMFICGSKVIYVGKVDRPSRQHFSFN